jgi:hypothetical protein
MPFVRTVDPSVADGGKGHSAVRREDVLVPDPDVIPLNSQFQTHFQPKISKVPLPCPRFVRRVERSERQHHVIGIAGLSILQTKTLLVCDVIDRAGEPLSPQGLFRLSAVKGRLAVGRLRHRFYIRYT